MVPTSWLLSSDEPWARHHALIHVLDHPEDDGEVARVRAAVVAHPAVQALAGSLPDWEAPQELSGHNHPAFAPNRLRLLWDMGIRAGDHPRVDATLEAMLRHQDPDGRFQSFSAMSRLPAPAWCSLPCDGHALLETLALYRVGGAALERAALRVEADATFTAQGPGWLCRPDPTLPFRGPGRKGDLCPQATVEALRGLGRLGSRSQVPSTAARTLLQVWLRRGREQPYMFGHGQRFKAAKWPRTWYDAGAVLEALAPTPDAWEAGDERRAVVELLACWLAYNLDASGRVTPRSTFKGFETWSFGQKKAPSPFATAVVWGVAHRFGDRVEEARALDVCALESSKGGQGTARPPALKP